MTTTFIMFTSDNGGSEPVEMNRFAGQAATKEQTQKFLAGFNNSVPNVGNSNSLVNYGAWGSDTLCSLRYLISS